MVDHVWMEEETQKYILSKRIKLKQTAMENETTV